MTEKSGILAYVGSTNGFQGLKGRASQVYEVAVRYNAADTAIQKLKEADRDQLRNIRTFVLEEGMIDIIKSPKREVIKTELFGEGKSVPKREMLAVWLAAEIGKIFKKHQLPMPVIIFTTSRKEIVKRKLVGIDAIIEDKASPEVADVFSRMTEEIVAKRATAQGVR